MRQLAPIVVAPAGACAGFGTLAPAAAYLQKNRSFGAYTWQHGVIWDIIKFS